jgi:hypothetical protein
MGSVAKSYMTLQPVPSEIPHMRKISFSFFFSVVINIVMQVLAAERSAAEHQPAAQQRAGLRAAPRH